MVIFEVTKYDQANDHHFNGRFVVSGIFWVDVYTISSPATAMDWKVGFDDLMNGWMAGSAETPKPHGFQSPYGETMVKGGETTDDTMTGGV